jgi:DNA-binding CsgD family transcriptional regulator
MADTHSVPSTGIVFRRSPTVLVGREQEQVFLREELAASRSGQGRLVLLGGEAGIGKTTLARDLAAEARVRNACVLVGHCYDLTNTPPYGPWLDLLAGYPDDAALPLPPAAMARGFIDRVNDQAALFADVRRFFAELSANRHLLVIFEDLHWADPASLELLRHVATYLRQWPILLLGTYRVDELTPRHTFSRQLPSLLRVAEGLRLSLRRLDAAAIRRLVATQYGLPESEETRLAAYLDRHAEGNPFYSTELLRALEEKELLRHDAGIWAFDETDRVVVPPLLRQVIDSRVDRLGADVRDALAIAAIIGQEVPLALWAAVAGLDDAPLLTIVERAASAHLLDAEPDGAHVRFVHALTREALYDGVLAPRRRILHRQVAEALLARRNPDPDAVAYHLQQAGDVRAWEWLVKAGDRAQQAYAWLTAGDRMQAAASLLEGMPGMESERCRLLYRLARLKRFSLPAEAFALNEQAENLARHVNDPVLAADILFHRGVVLGYANQFRSGLAAIEASAAALEAMPLAAARFYASAGPWLADSPPDAGDAVPAGADLAADALHATGPHSRRAAYPWLCAAAGQAAAAIASAEHYLAAYADQELNRGIRFSTAYAWHGVGIAQAALARPDEARAAWGAARDIFAENDHHALFAITVLDELRDVALTYDAANPAARRGLAAEAEAAIDRAGGAFRPGISARIAWLGPFLLDGRWDEADRILRESPEPGNAHLERDVTVTAALLARHRGDPDAAWKRIFTRLPGGPATEPGDCILQEGLLLVRLAADLCLDETDLQGAQTWLNAHDRWLDWSGSILGRADGRRGWARYHAVARRPAQARVRAAEAIALSSAPPQPLTSLAAHRLLGEVEMALGRHANAESALDEALVLADACEAPFERALTLLPFAELLTCLGRASEAAAALEQVRHICAPLGAQPAIDQTDALEARLATAPGGSRNPAGLTDREIEVLRLLAQRQTDKEIAVALFLGPRTVQSHVGNILNKLRVSNRREAAVAAERLGLA